MFERKSKTPFARGDKVEYLTLISTTGESLSTIQMRSLDDTS